MNDGSFLDKISKNIKNEYKRIYGDAVLDIYLYGSYARGDYNEASDIDYVAIVQGERLDLQKKIKKVWEAAAYIGMDMDVVISPTVIPYNEFIRYRDILPYYKNIIKEGVKIG